MRSPSRALVAFFLVVLAADAVDLTNKTFSSQVLGKRLMVVFKQIGCSHCTAMQAAWDELMKKYENHDTALIAQVDCGSEAGQPLCEYYMNLNLITGFPQILWGNPYNLQNYRGARAYEVLAAHVEANVSVLQCSPSNIHLCNEARKVQIEELQSLNADDLEQRIKIEETKWKEADAAYEADMKEINQDYAVAWGAMEKEKKAAVRAATEGKTDKEKAAIEKEENEKMKEKTNVLLTSLQGPQGVAAKKRLTRWVELKESEVMGLIKEVRGIKARSEANHSASLPLDLPLSHILCSLALLLIGGGSVAFSTRQAQEKKNNKRKKKKKN